MPYSKSTARVDFEDSFKMMLKNSRDASLKKTKISYSHRIMIYQTSIFLLSASFEGYLKSLIEDLIYSFKTNSASIGDLPSNFRSMLLLQSQINIFKGYIFNGDEGKILEKLNPENNYYKIVNQADSFTNQIPPGLIIGTKKYPSIKNLNTLFNRLGIKKITKIIVAKSGRNYELDLKSFLDIRETIAHDIAPSITFEDVKRHYQNIDKIIGQIDRLTYSQIVKLSGASFWIGNL